MASDRVTILEVESEALLGNNWPSLSENPSTQDFSGCTSSIVPQCNWYGSISRGSGEEQKPHLSHDSDGDVSWQAELQDLSKKCPPLVLTLILQISFNLITVWVAGHLGTAELGAASLANMTANVTGFCVYEGLATSLDTLTSQAYGAGKKQLVGLYVQRMCIQSLVATIPVALVWLFSPTIIQALIPEKDLAIMAGQYLRVLLIGAPGWAIFEAGRRFTQAQGEFNASMWVTLGCLPICLLLNWWLVFHNHFGLEGAALALAITYTAQPIGLVLYVVFISPATLKCWPGIQWREALQQWAPMLRLAVPGVVMTLSEWLAFELLTFSCSYLGPKRLAAQSVVMTIAVFTYHAVPYPVAIACSVRFGNIIGKGALMTARSIWNLYYLLFICIGIVDMIVLTSLQHEIAALFTKDPDVRRAISAVLPIVAAAQFFDALLAISNGLLRGLGRQAFGGWVNICVYYVMAIPCSLVLTFGPLGMGLSGLWIGPCLGVGLGSVAIAMYMRMSGWDQAVADAIAHSNIA